MLFQTEKKKSHVNNFFFGTHVCFSRLKKMLRNFKENLIDKEQTVKYENEPCKWNIT